MYDNIEVIHFRNDCGTGGGDLIVNDYGLCNMLSNDEIQALLLLASSPNFKEIFFGDYDYGYSVTKLED
jgi:hypothetical protein